MQMFASYEEENIDYWTKRTPGYLEVNQGELASRQRAVWSSVISQRIAARFPGKTPDQIKVLDVGTGPGFFAVILTELGYRVAAVDYTASMLKGLDVSYDVPEPEIRARIQRIEQDTGMVLDGLQAEAVKEAVTNGLMVITGGPGTGKTTTINTIIRYFELEGMDIFLGAPTGRAAKRARSWTRRRWASSKRTCGRNGSPTTMRARSSATPSRKPASASCR